jgi:hypothetical protein
MMGRPGVRKPKEITMPARRNCLATLCVLFLSATPLGCGEDKPGEEENPNVEACEHIEMGPAVALTAATTSSASAPKLGDDHKRYDVSMVDVTGGKGGYVSFAASKAGEYIFFTTAPVTLKVKTSAMADVAVESSAAMIAECTQVKGRFVYDLEVGTYIIAIGPETVDKVSFVVEPGAH